MKSKRHRSPRPDTRKCVKMLTGVIERLRTEPARMAVTSGMGVYVTKKEWKAQRGS